MLLVWEFQICIWRGTIITLLQFFSFVYRFLQDVNKVVDYCIVIIIIIIIIIIKTAFYVPCLICFLLQVYWWHSLHFTSFHLYLCPTPSVRAQSSSPMFGWFLAQAVKFPAPLPSQVKIPSLEMSFNPSQDFVPLWRCCIYTFSSLLLTLTRLAFSCRQLARASVQFAHFLLIA